MQSPWAGFSCINVKCGVLQAASMRASSGKVPVRRTHGGAQDAAPEVPAPPADGVRLPV